ncbi:MAG: exo-alpha-sialidase [Acidobacteria bacterium]|nr:MAG: exo-alpha-sialidase [Acidobacteriota bacterium]REK07862.1 MAG: exo-alpha-sialidase [Acidobacteriota bacterium]
MVAVAAAQPAPRTGPVAEPHGPVVLRELVFEPPAEFAECHASTVLAVAPGPGSEGAATDGEPRLLVAWFGGSREGAEDVAIWLAQRPLQASGAVSPGGWSAPRLVARSADTEPGAAPLATWNPVLHRGPGEDDPIELFYKVGPNPRQWWGAVRRSHDLGDSWGPAERLPAGFLGPIRSRPLELGGGVLLAPSSSEHDGWRIHFERRGADGTWSRVEVPGQQPSSAGTGEALSAIEAIQPSLLRHPDGDLQALSRSRQGRIAETFSRDGGRSWSPPQLTELPNPSAGVEALTLPGGNHLLVYNHHPGGVPWPEARSRLDVALSRDGRTWYALTQLEYDDPEQGELHEYSYPAAVVGPDGLVHVTYTWRRRSIRHVVLDPARFGDAWSESRRIVGGEWPEW